jgi:PAS domain S-box-containing protein
MKGYSLQEILGRHFSIFYLPESVASGLPSHELALAQKKGRCACEGWRVRKDGTTFWASVIIMPLRQTDGKLCGFAKVTRDISERRMWEERIQRLTRELRSQSAQVDESKHIVELRTLELQRLSRQLLQLQDEERRRLARDLHDDLAQQLTSLKMLLGRDSRNEEATEIANACISTVRNLTYLLHPPLLDEAGLCAALQWFVDGLSKRAGIEISLETKPVDFPRLSKDAEVTIFRIVQESLNNVVRHSGGENALVEIEIQAEWVRVGVRDYGKGAPLQIANTISSSRLGVGISGMRERVRQLGGELTVSFANPGTLVEAKIPLSA